VSELTRYKKPYPDPDSLSPWSEECCESANSGFRCTREPGHGGDHQATGPTGEMLASWPGGEQP